MSGFPPQQRFNTWVTIVFSILSFCCIPQTVTAQRIDECRYALEGVFLDIETKEPIPYVYVQVAESNKSVVADEKGAFRLEGLCSPTHKLAISCIGYCDTTCQHGSSEEAYIYLHKKEVSLESVTIVG